LQIKNWIEECRSPRGVLTRAIVPVFSDRYGFDNLCQ
jgi:hypothetical protein